MLIKFYALSLAVLIFSGAVNAAGISQQTAQTIALNFYKVTYPDAGHGQLTANLAYTQTESNGSVDFYAFNMGSNGFVIVSATDNVMPVLAYSSESNFSPNFGRMGVSDWVKHVSINIHKAVTQNIAATTRIQQLWSAYLNGQKPAQTKGAPVLGPMLRTTWNQEPYYNALCPYDSAQSERAVTGCVATAMAQIMKYWAYPAQGTGSYSYDDAPPQFSNNYGEQSANFGATIYNWAAMANNVTSNTSPADTLSYQCGVAVAMDYGDDEQDGSGAFVTQAEAGAGNPCAQMAYATYFSYNPNTMQGVKQASYNSSDWLNLMRNEMNQGRVVQYEGDDPTAGGHTWVCDGYDNTDMLHMNWGWGGAYNGYYVPSNLDADGYNFDENDGALIGIEPLYPITVSASADNNYLCTGGVATLTAQGPATATYSWTPTTGLSCSTCSSTTANPTATTLYTCTIDSAGVTAKAFVTISIAGSITANFTLATATGCTLPQTVTFTNNTSNATSYIWEFGDGTTDTTSSPVHEYNAYGNFNVTLVGLNACYSDSLVKTGAVQVLDKGPVSADQNICSGQSANLTATDTYGSVSWYNTPTGGTAFNNSDSYTTGPLSATTTYYVEASIPSNPTQAGPADSTIGTGNYYTHTTTHGLSFNSLESQTLTSVTVYASNSGSRTIQLLNAAGTEINSYTATIAAGKQTVPLNFALPIADSLQLVIGGTVNLHRNETGAQYPYVSTDGNLIIVGTTSGSNYGGNTAYYYFYNWQLQPNPCVTARTAIPVFVLSVGGVSFSATGTYNQVSFIPADTNATSYTWNFGDGTSSTLVNPVHAYSANGTYTAQLIVSNGSCTDTTTETINTLTLGVNDLSSWASLSVFPNPAKYQITLSVVSNQSLDNCSISIHNMLGQQISQSFTGLHEGVNNFDLNFNSLADGVYVIDLRNGEDVITRRFIKEN